MTIQYCSDLHLEFPENWKYLQKKPLIPAGEILVLAGDIMPFTLQDQFNDFIDSVSAAFKVVYWTPGNHEYYGSDIQTPGISVFKEIRPNFFLVNNREVRYRDTTLLFSTLWSPITPQHEWDIRKSVADYRAIRVNGQSLVPADTNAMHLECLAFLEKALVSPAPVETTPSQMPEIASSKKIVVTHHVPTLLNYPSEYRNSTLTEAFAVELYDLIENSGADYWIYGHHHVNTPAFRIGRTELLTNQLGYVRLGEQRKFRWDAVITLA